MMQRCDSRGAADRRTGRFSLDVLPHMLHLRWTPRIAIDRNDIAGVGSAIAMSGSPTLPLLVEVTKLKEITWEARTAILSHEFPARVAVLGTDAVDLVLTAFLVKARTDARFFTEWEEAERWVLRG
ncbi:hypothetical protein [Arthrobacter sp. SX1312]|uniref:hypothetical protein n=1 Tax=Arthrobacter sp. SX1312 TaxID=2058896 RepID=UPI000CE2E4B8|nr:hypothetical protein [Arthrobacter sp. SX1312]